MRSIKLLTGSIAISERTAPIATQSNKGGGYREKERRKESEGGGLKRDSEGGKEDEKRKDRGAKEDEGKDGKMETRAAGIESGDA